MKWNFARHPIKSRVPSTHSHAVQLLYAGITRLPHRCITPLWSLRDALPSDWLLLGRALCSCACRRSPVWCHLIGSYIHVCVTINHHHHHHHHRHPRRRTQHRTRAAHSTRFAALLAPSTVYCIAIHCRIYSHNERDSIYFVFSLASRKLFCVAQKHRFEKQFPRRLLANCEKKDSHFENSSGRAHKISYIKMQSINCIQRFNRLLRLYPLLIARSITIESQLN